MTVKKTSAQDAMKKWSSADKKQRRTWHWANRIKAAKVRGEADEVIAALEAQRDAELKTL